MAKVSDDSPSGSHELHVLAVDDSLVDRTVIERLLKISSCKVTSVDSGTRALQYLGLDGDKGAVGLDGLKVNLIMTDYSMPGMTGYELLKKIKESSVFKEIPVVIMSSENILPRIDRCLEEGAEDFLLKPVKLSDVKRLKDFIMKGEGKENGEEGKESGENKIHKRMRQDDHNCLTSPLLPLSSPWSPACDPSSPLMQSSSLWSSSSSSPPLSAFSAKRARFTKQRLI